MIKKLLNYKKEIINKIFSHHLEIFKTTGGFNESFLREKNIIYLLKTLGKIKKLSKIEEKKRFSDWSIKKITR